MLKAAVYSAGPRDAVRWAVALIMLGAAALMPGAAARGAGDGVMLCLSSVIPSLFMLLFAVVFMTECGLAAWAAELLSPLCSRLFGLSGCTGAALLASLIGGYPAGAKTAAALYEKGMITRGEARRTVMFCFGAGPAFILGTAGRMLPGYSSAILLAVQTVVIPVSGITLKYVLPPDKEDEVHPRYGHSAVKNADVRSLPECVVTAARQTSAALLDICIFVVLFSAVRAMLEDCGIAAFIENTLRNAGVSGSLSNAALPMLLEVTGGLPAACAAGLPAAAFALSFGGLSVHMQVYGISRKIGVDPLRFEFTRIMCGLLSAALTALLSRAIPGAVSAAVMTGYYQRQMTASCPAGAITLLVMCVMLEMCVEEQNNTRLRA